MTTPQVSVIIPTRNRPALLPTAIRSVLAQTFSDFELVVVDDASDQLTDSVMEQFQDQRVRLIRHKRRLGGAAARNTGIRETHGAFVAFLDDDDEWYPEKLARQVRLLLGSPLDMGAVYTGYNVVERDTGRVVSRMLPEHRGDVSSVLLRGNRVGPTSSFLLRRTCFEDVGMFDETMPSFQEYDLWIRLSKIYKFDYVSACLFNYHVHSKRIWTNPAAISEGVDILVQKHGTSETFRKTCSESYLSVAVQFCDAGERKKARDVLRRAIGLYPFDARHYMYFFLSFLNQPTYLRVQDSKAKILDWLGGVCGNRMCRS